MSDGRERTTSFTKKTMLNGKTCLKESVGSELEQSKPIGFSAYQKVITPLHQGGNKNFYDCCSCQLSVTLAR